MASSTSLSSHHSPNFLQLQLHSPQFRLILAGISLSQSKQGFSRKLLLWQQQQPRRSWDPLRRIGAKEVLIKCFAEAAEERESAGETVLDKDRDDGVSDEEVNIGQDFSNGAAVSQRIPDSLSLGIREPVYEVIYRAALFSEFSSC